MVDISEYQVPSEFRRSAKRNGFSLHFSAFLVGPIVFGVDLLLIVATSLLSGIVYHQVMLQSPGDIPIFVGLGTAVFFYLSVFMAYRGDYSVGRLMQSVIQCREVTIAWAAVFLMLVTLAFLMKVGPNLSRGATVAFFVTGWCAMIAWRVLLGAHLRHAQSRRLIVRHPVVILSDRPIDQAGPHLSDLATHGFSVARFLVLPKSREQLLGCADDLLSMARCESRIEGFFLLLDWGDGDRIDVVVNILRGAPLPVRLFPDARVAGYLGRHALSVSGVWATEIQRAPLSFEERFAKRGLDILVSGGLLVLLLPVMLASAVLVRISSRGPILFLQTRTGFNARPFKIFKFRTLTSMDDGPVVKQVSRDDERMTRVGRTLRRTSIDELPQLINILRGDMSFVGPRPHATAHSDYYGHLIANYAHRHHVKPGLTGWAQVNGFRGETTLPQMKARVAHDLWYIDNWSLWLDIKIILKTCIVLLRSPAY